MVANDAASANSTIERSLMMAAPATCKTAIKAVDDVIRMLQNPKAKEHNILILVNCPADLIRILKNVSDIEAVNIGNYGRIAPKQDGMERKTYGANLYLYPIERDALKQVKELGYDAFYQTTPEDTKESLDKLLTD